MTRLAIWLSTGDNAFGVVCVACAPLLTVVLIGMIGSGT